MRSLRMRSRNSRLSPANRLCTSGMPIRLRTLLTAWQRRQRQSGRRAAGARILVDRLGIVQVEFGHADQRIGMAIGRVAAFAVPSLVQVVARAGGSAQRVGLPLGPEILGIADRSGGPRPLGVLVYIDRDVFRADFRPVVQDRQVETRIAVGIGVLIVVVPQSDGGGAVLLGIERIAPYGLEAIDEILRRTDSAGVILVIALRRP